MEQREKYSRFMQMRIGVQFLLKIRFRALKTFLFLLLGCFGNVYAQSYFQKTLGTSSNETYGIIKPLANGNYIVAGRTDVNGLPDFLLMEVDPAFQPIWTTTLGSSSFSEEIFDIVEQPSGNLQIMGRQNERSIRMETNNLGAIISSTILGSNDDRLRFIFENLAGDYVAFGELEGAIPPLNRVALIQYDNAMNILLKRWFDPGASEITIPGSYELYGRGIKQLPDSSYILVCHLNEAGVGVTINDQTRIIKLDKSFNISWVKGYWGAEYSRAQGIVVLPNGEFIVYGNTLAYNPAGGYDMLVTKLDANGNHIWSKTYGTTADEDIMYGMVTQDSNILFTAYSEGVGFGGKDVVNMKIDTSGNLIWAKAYGGLGDEMPLKCIENGNAYITSGETNSFSGGSGSFDLYLIRTDTDGIVADSCFMDVTTQLILGSGIPTEYTRLYTTNTFTDPTAITFNNIAVNIVDSTVCTLCPQALFSSDTTCLGDITLFTNLSSNYDSSYWDFGDLSNSSLDSPTHTCSAAGVYNVQLFVYNTVNGCVDSISDSITIVDFNISITPGDTSICNGQNVTFDAGSGYASYLWSTSDIGQMIMATTQGSYSVTVTNADGCTTSDTLTLSVIPNADATILSIPEFCEGESDSLLQSVEPGGQWSGVGITNTNTGVFSPIAAGSGSHNIIYEIAGQCGDSDTVTVIVNSNPQPLIVASAGFCESTIQ
jgi:hypothetical protein